MSTGEVEAEYVRISRDELREIVREETGAAVTRAFQDVGLYPDTPDERRKIRADFMYLRRWRESVDGASMQVGRAVLLAIAGGILAAMWLGFKMHVLRQP